MHYEQIRHRTRAWLFHFFGNEQRAFDEYSIAFRFGADVKIARNLGFIATHKKLLNEGVYWFSEATKLDPNNAETWFNLGFSLERNSPHREAVDAFAESVRLNPNLDRAWYGMALSYAALGNHTGAAAAFEETVKLQPMHGEAWYHLGMAHHNANNHARVAQVIEKLRSFEPKRANQLIQETGRGDLSHLYTEMPF